VFSAVSNPAFRSAAGVCCVLSVLLFAAACGGRSEHTPDSTESSDAETSSPGSGSPSNTSEGNELDDDLALGECFEGWPPFEGECPWLGSDDLCYATKADACACLCPRDKASTCVSGLPGGPDSHTRVSCF
jgi:hypothetical protein